jgi:hypothetical protein
MQVKTLLGPASLVAIIVSIAGCGTSTKTSNVWLNQAEISARGPLKSVLVYGESLAPESRQKLEEGLVISLRERGVHAEPSYAYWPNSPPVDSEVRAILAHHGFDGLLVTRMRGIKRQVDYVSPGPTLTAEAAESTVPGTDSAYVDRDTYVRFDTTLREAKTGSIIWAADTQTVNPTSERSFVSSLSKELMTKLQGAGLVGPAAKQ